jgi:hypothetical protein
MGSGLGGFGSGSSSINGGRGSALSVDVKGGDKLKARFKVWKAGLTYAGENIPRQIAEDAADIARGLVAVDTSKTQQNIRVRGRRKGAEVVVTRGGQRDEVPAYLEFGTYKMAARPFLAPAGRMATSAAGLKRASRKVGGLIEPMRGI